MFTFPSDYEAVSDLCFARIAIIEANYVYIVGLFVLTHAKTKKR